jgi:hypothetical protein
MLVGALGAMGTASAQTVYRCVQPGGQVAFQDAPCAPGSGREIEVTKPNLVQGDAAGGQRMRAEWERSSAVRSALARGEVIEGMTADEVRQVLGRPVAVRRSVAQGQTVERLDFEAPDGTRRRVTLREGTTVAVDSSIPLRPRGGQPCHSEKEIRNVEFGASSVTRSPEEKRALRERVREMRACTR